jgi:Peptidase family M41
VPIVRRLAFIPLYHCLEHMRSGADSGTLGETDGMDSEIGRVSYGHRNGDESLHKPFSEKTGELLDSQVRRLVSQVHRRATEVLTERRADLDKIAKLLLEREVISRFVVVVSVPLSDAKCGARPIQRGHDRPHRPETI